MNGYNRTAGRYTEHRVQSTGQTSHSIIRTVITSKALFTANFPHQRKSNIFYLNFSPYTAVDKGLLSNMTSF